MLQLLKLSSVSVMLSAGLAQAADIANPTASDWNGFYVGIQGGYGGGTFDFPMNLKTDFSPADTNNLDYDFGANLTSSGFFGGLQAGWNWQVERFVLGIEGDISVADIAGEMELYSDTANASVKGGSQVDWFATARLRGGFLATPDLLLYATGGFAWGSVNASYDLDLGSLGQLDDGTTESHMGWSLGGGLEYAVTPNISVKTEYLYVDLGKAELLNEDLSGIINSQARGSVDLKIEQDISFHSVRAGINYRF